ncbi:transposase [Trichonephila clavata]|uniref:Transposase n=1 Tax=Trichonephila clavata TaxID=2740835 RepID=A0A8X6F6S1_TRICU|nr:transposase [Trichonephila clavata]
MALSKFLNVRNDYAFKRIFGTEKNKDILIHFLNDILDLTDDNQIKDVSFLSPIQDPVIASQKQSIVDVLCVDSTGVKTIIEMQVAKTRGFEKRAQYYAAKAYSSQADAYDELNQYNWSKEERLAYDQAKKRTDDYLSTLEEKLHEGILIGKEEGILIGHEKGREEGEKQAKIAVAKEMLADKVNTNTIAKFTGLSINEIEEL